jgi:hypothetical protein
VGGVGQDSTDTCTQLPSAKAVAEHLRLNTIITWVPGFDPGLYVIPSRIWLCRSLGGAPLCRAPSRKIWFSFVPLFYIVGPRSYDHRPPTKPYISRAYNMQFLFPSLYLDFRQFSTIIAGLSLYIILEPL